MKVLVTRKEAMGRCGITPTLWRKARQSGKLQPACGKIYKRSPYFQIRDVMSVFGVDATCFQGD
jgi:hypothetical protein